MAMPHVLSRLVPLLLVVALPACRGCSRGGGGQDAFANAFLPECRKQGDETYCACMAEELKKRQDQIPVEQMRDVAERGALPPPAFADAVDACGQDGDALRVGRPFRAEVAETLKAACLRRGTEVVCDCVSNTLQSRYALAHVHADIGRWAREDLVGGAILPVVEECQRGQ